MKISALVGACALFAQPAFSADIYNCKMNVTDNNRVISKAIVISYDAKTGESFVADEFIQYYMGSPVDARVLTDNDKRITFGWSLRNIKPKQGNSLQEVAFKLTYMKATHKAHAVSSVPEFGFSESGFGVCSIKKT